MLNPILPMRYRSFAFAAVALLSCAAAPPIAAQAADPDTTRVHPLDSLYVEVARLRAGGIPLARLPFGAEVIGGGLESGGLILPEALDATVGISTASQFGSTVQPDLRFRGFQVGPVVGFPQSVSVFVDGVRVNEPDASQVNFDLIPMAAVERIEVIRAPGGPFGRNALAGAVNLVTRRGDAGEAITGAVEV